MVESIIDKAKRLMVKEFIPERINYVFLVDGDHNSYAVEVSVKCKCLAGEHGVLCSHVLASMLKIIEDKEKKEEIKG